MLSSLTLIAPSMRPVLIELYAVGAHISAPLPSSVNPHVALAGKLNYLGPLACFREESQMRTRVPFSTLQILVVRVHRASISSEQRPSHGE